MTEAGSTAGREVTPLEQLVAIEEIKRLKYQYVRALDTKNWQQMGSLFSPDITIDLRGAPEDLQTLMLGLEEAFGEEQPIRGAAACIHHLTEMAQGMRSVHHCHMPEIDVISATTARGTWAFEDIVWPEGSQGEAFRGYGFFHETYERLDGQWRIASMRFSWTHLAP